MTSRCILLFVASFLCGSLPAQSAADLLRGRTLPAARLQTQTTDTRAAAETGLFSPSLLDDYVLLEFSRWRLEGAPLEAPADLRVYSMLDTPAALGLFTLARDRLEGDPGLLPWPLEAASDSRQLLFWKSNFFFQLETAAALPLPRLRDWAEQVTSGIEQPPVYPMSVVQLPEEDLQPETVRFYLSAEALANDSGFPRPLLEALGFEEEAEVASARYLPGGRTLYLIGYPTAAVAEQYFHAIQQKLHTIFSQPGIYSKRSGLLVALLEAPEEEARPLLERVHYNASVKWIYEKDTSAEDLAKQRGELLTFFGIITTSLVFTGIFMVVMLAGGLAVGVVRYRFLQKFPRLRSGDELIRLDLQRTAVRAEEKLT